MSGSAAKRERLTRDHSPSSFGRQPEVTAALSWLGGRRLSGTRPPETIIVPSPTFGRAASNRWPYSGEFFLERTQKTGRHHAARHRAGKARAALADDRRRRRAWTFAPRRVHL